MRSRKSRKYKNYGSIPQNEYRMDPTEADTGSDAPLESNQQADGVAYRQRLMRRQALHPSGLKRSSGWVQTWKANGWRAESAAQDDELTEADRYSRHGERNHPL